MREPLLSTRSRVYNTGMGVMRVRIWLAAESRRLVCIRGSCSMMRGERAGVMSVGSMMRSVTRDPRIQSHLLPPFRLTIPVGTAVALLRNTCGTQSTFFKGGRLLVFETVPLWLAPKIDHSHTEIVAVTQTPQYLRHPIHRSTAHRYPPFHPITTIYLITHFPNTYLYQFQ
jgi:hypothetical protein